MATVCLHGAGTSNTSNSAEHAFLGCGAVSRPSLSARHRTDDDAQPISVGEASARSYASLQSPA